jgi:hypothetical protein
MKTILHFLLLLFSFAFQLHAQPVTVSVGNGSGSGTYTTGDTAYIFSNPTRIVPSRRVFDRWAGDTASLVDPFSSSTSLRVPSGAVTVKAVYRSAPRWTAVSDSINGAAVTITLRRITKL